ncbi:MAG: 16S rRNA (cytidine(1402)-2'-O)-methyltransferase [Bacteriovoracaceae bacterium]|jgi:16S rRNA (cytidine1402-2'-O)-methyltransferase|nr:16S rRNA (cytidine(1402)-2'-O)-methyltransferase [Bacteriovoracaceae bacterium]
MAKLTLLGLPLGNIEDLTARALEGLKSGELFICEDTRNLIKIFGHLKISTQSKKLISYHEHSTEHDLDRTIKTIKDYPQAYMVSDAGSPIISDPAYPLIRGCLEKGIEIDSFPGPTSPITALELAGLPPQPCMIHGFFPRDSEKRKDKIEFAGSRSMTHIFFESPYRVMETLELLCNEFPGGRFCLARELTKLFQQVVRFKGDEFSSIADQITLKGEMVIVFYIDVKESRRSDKKLTDLAQKVLEQAGKKKIVAKLVAEILGENPKNIYQKLIDGPGEK